MWLQKKPASGRVRVRLLVGELMMAAVNGDPARRCFLQAGHRDDDHGVLEPFGTFQAAVGEKPMVAKVDAEQPAQMGADDRNDEAAPGEIAGHEGKHRHGVIGADADDVRPVQLETVARPQATKSGSRQAAGEGRRARVQRFLRSALERSSCRDRFHFYRSSGRAAFWANSCYTGGGACIAFINPRLFDAAVCRKSAFESVV